MVDSKNTYIDEVYKNIDISKDDYMFKLADEILFNVLKLKFDNEEKKRMLDIGCGKGFSSVAFSKYFNVTGVDISNVAVETLGEINIPFEFNKLNLEKDKLPIQDNSFDLIFSKSVVENISNIDYFFSEIKRVLNPGGNLVLMTPAWETHYRAFFDDCTHVRPYTKHGLKMLLKLNNFSNVEVCEFYQLPFIWKWPFLKFVPKVVSLLPDRYKWKDNDRSRQNKFIRFSKETMLLATATK